MITEPTGRSPRGWRALLGAMVLVAMVAAPAQAQLERIFDNGFEPRALGAAPQLRILRDDRVATIDMDYNAEDPWGQFWEMSGSPEDNAGFLVSWWPATAAAPEGGKLFGKGDSIGCLNPEHGGAMSPVDKAAPAGARWLVTGNRRVQIQPLENGVNYTVRVERLNALGRITSVAAEQTFPGGDGTRVAALRNSMTYFDDFNRPAGAADEKLWGNAAVTSTDPRFNLFFINDQFHAHTLNGTHHEPTGDRSQTSQRFRKKVRIQPGVRRKIVFDMDSPLSPRSVWYLDLNPIPTELTAHASFFDQEGDIGLPAGVLRLRAVGQDFSVSLIDNQGSLHRVANVQLEDVGRQAVSNVRRQFEARVGTDGIEVLIDGRSVINATYAPQTFAAGDYELLWVGFGYNTTKDNNPYYLLHWDNFGFDGPVVDARTVHNYVTRIAGSDYQLSGGWDNLVPTFTVKIPDDLRPVTAGATAEAWLVYTYQMGDYSTLSVLPTDFVRVNGAMQYPLPQPANNSTPYNANLMLWGIPHTARIKLGDLVQGGGSPLRVGDNHFQFNADNAGILNVHVEVAYPPGSAPTYTPPAAIHHFPMHAELPRLGLPARLQKVGETNISSDHLMDANPPARIPVRGVVPLNIEVGNRSWADWAPQLMHVPVQSMEIFSSGGTAGIGQVDVYLRRVGTGTGPGERVIHLDTARDAPAPQGRYLLSFDTRGFANGDYELFVQATSPSGLKSHPSYGDEMHHFEAQELSGGYYPIQVRIEN
ncbi:hypothetical protein [Tahibacter amnicola]|uniref:Uncharacterized protein n=1 Tax=Tahibacter amnicola TaxID=2976241 RepID=A0ABY6B9E9_9GAMM|nr:hypothetical protein [Tahibacter amnicola]UXI65810.1 hypothetical protein N4264_13655 [Tahibacter amnicola]